MRVAIQVPLLPRPHGGMTVLFEYGNGLVRRGHEVTMILTPMGFGVAAGVETEAELRQLEWLTVDDSLSCIDGTDAAALAGLDPEVLLRFSAEPLAGPPSWSAREFVVVQALRVLPSEFEDALLAYPAPKLCVSEWLVDAVAKQASTSELASIFHLPSGIDHQRFTPSAPAGADTAAGSSENRAERDIDVLMIFNPAPTKAAKLGVRATELVRKSNPGLRVEVFGGYERPDWLADHITYHRQPNRSELVRLYRRSKTFLLSSALEGFGLASLEAMACGAALITTDNGGSADFAVHDANALVSPPGERDPLAHHVQRLLANPELRIRLTTAARHTAAQYRWETTIDRLEAILLNPAVVPPALS